MNESKLEPKAVFVCLGCGDPTTVHKRGRCLKCYKLALQCIKEGCTTWEFMESTGFALPPKNKKK